MKLINTVVAKGDSSDFGSCPCLHSVSPQLSSVTCVSLLRLCFFHPNRCFSQKLEVIIRMPRLKTIHTACQEASHQLCLYRTDWAQRESDIRKWAVRYFASWLWQDWLAVIFSFQVLAEGKQIHTWLY